VVIVTVTLSNVKRFGLLQTQSFSNTLSFAKRCASTTQKVENTQNNFRLQQHIITKEIQTLSWTIMFAGVVANFDAHFVKGKKNAMRHQRQLVKVCALRSLL